MEVKNRGDTRKANLLAADGIEGKLFAGREVSWATWYRNYLVTEGHLLGPVIFRKIGTSLLVRPRILENQIEVTLTPEVSYETEESRGKVAVTKLSATVIVPNGKSVEIGAGIQETESENNYYRRETTEAVPVIFTPRIVER